VNLPVVRIACEQALDLEDFRKMDYYAVENYGLPIELMMENAGLNLARLVAQHVAPQETIQIGVGPGNNGGGGLVAARRLLAWGFKVHLHLPPKSLQGLPQKQLERALSFGAKPGLATAPSVYVDAYLGFSQRLPLSQFYLEGVQYANGLAVQRIALDIPTGLAEEGEHPFFNADIVCTLAAPKKVLFSKKLHATIYIADLGIPQKVYDRFGMDYSLPFEQSGLLLMEQLPA